MARLLYRLGLGSARRPLVAILSWLLALALAVGAFLAFGGTLTSAVTIPGTPTAQVTDRLKEEFPDAARGTGQVLFITEDGTPFTPEQKEGVAAALEQVAGQEPVAAVLDPFEVADRQADAERELAEGRQEIADGERELEDGRAQIDDGRAQLAEAREQADEGEQELADAKAQLDEGQEQLDAARARFEEEGLAALPAEATAPLTEAEQRLEEGRAELEAGRAELEERRAEQIGRAHV